MKCRLCDRPTAAASGKLCTDCTKALNRARGATLRKLASAQAEHEAAPPIDLPLSVAPAVETPRWKRRAVWATMSLAAIAIVYFGQHEYTSPPGAEAVIVERSSPASAERPEVDAVPVVSRVEEPSWTSLGNAADTPGTADALKTASAVNAPKSPVPTVASGPKAGAKAKAASQDPKPLSNATAFVGETPAPPASEPPQSLARASVPPPQPLDGAQVLASAMERCGKETLLSKFICEQKMHMQYCEDKWDKDPRCVRRTASN